MCCVLDHSYDELSNEPLSVIQKNRTPSEAFFYAAGAGATAADASSSLSASPSAPGSASASAASASSGVRSSSRNSNSTSGGGAGAAAGAGEQQSEEQQIEELFRVRCKERDLRALLEARHLLSYWLAIRCAHVRQIKHFSTGHAVTHFVSHFVFDKEARSSKYNYKLVEYKYLSIAKYKVYYVKFKTNKH